ncbi:hypothetical protein [Micromonospora sp. NPDC005305]|uniref:hypothetical protein n=1 Tax=Micromonospora sp. NPDC005305 TaxID=3156875 RepID=UPI0033B16313
MAFRTWGRLLLTALGVSVLAGAGQLGIAYGFGVVRLDGAFVDDSVNRWPAQLAWVGWFAAVATVAGAVLTERLARRDASPAGTTELLSIAGVSGLGAIVVAPLCMQPARAAELGGTVDPVWAAGICAVLGAVVGAGTAIAVLLKPPFGWSIALSAAAVWLLALVSVAPSVASTGTLPTVRLGVLEPSWLDPAAAERLAMLLLPTLALLAGAAVGALARRAGHLPLVGGAAGAAGPVLLAFAYLTAGPGTAADRYQLAPYYGALIAVVAGALGSTATTVLPRPVTTAGEPDAIEPTDILQALPPSPATPDPAGPAPAAPVALRPAGAPSPAHWDWPEAGGLTPAPVPAGLTSRPPGRPGPERPADRDAPTPVHGPGLAGEREATRPDPVRRRFDAAPFSAAAGGTTDPTPDAHDADRPAPEPGSTARPGPIDGTTARPGRTDRTTARPGTTDGTSGRHLAPELDPDGPPATADVAPGVAHEVTPDGQRFDAPAAAFSPEQGSDFPRPGRPSEDTSLGQLPGSPPPGRRTSAIDVLAAGRPTPPADPEPVTSAPATAHAEVPRATGRTKAPSVSPDAVTRPTPTTEPAAPHAEATRATGRAPAPPVAPRPAPDRPEAAAPAAAAEREVAGPGSPEPATEAAPTRATRSRRARAASTPSPRPTDDAPSSARLADEPTQAGVPGAEAAAEAGESTAAAPAPAGRAKRTRKPRTTRAVPDQAPEPATATSDRTTEPTATTADTTAEPAATGPDGTSVRARSRRDDTTVQPGANTPDIASEPTGSISATSKAATARTPSTGAEPAGEARATNEPQTRATNEPDTRATNLPETRATDQPQTRAANVPQTRATNEPETRATDLPEAPASAEADASSGSTPAAGERRNFFFDPEPAPVDLPEPSASPRPRIPIFEDVTPGNVRPAWPIAPAANWPVTPRGGSEPAAADGPAAGPDAGPEGTAAAGRDAGPEGTAAAGPARPEPAPRPRHRALPDLGRSTGWEALANARPAGPAAPPPTGRTPDTAAPTGPVPENTDTTDQGPETTASVGRAPETSGPVPQTTGGTAEGADGAEAAGPVLPAWDAPPPQAAGSAPGGRHADVSGPEASPEAAGGKSKARRSLFRRNRGKGGEPGEVDRDGEPLAAQDEEYVDWVAGLASDDNADDARSLRTGRHHRD